MADVTVDDIAEHHVLGEGAEHPALASTTGLSNNKMGMWLFLGSECLLFGGLISTYMLYRGRNDGIGPDQVYDIPFTSVSSFVLLMSSLTMVLAVSAANRRDERNTKVWLVITALLGATFVGGQAYEFTSFYREGLGFTTSLFSSSFYTLTGFHGVHVSLGIIMLLALTLMIRADRVTGNKAEVVELIGLYWHFVDIVWIVIFTLVYLIPRREEIEARRRRARWRALTETGHHVTGGSGHEVHHGPAIRSYVWSPLPSPSSPALEVSLTYVDIGALFLPLLIVLMLIKFFTVVLFFMHLKFDNKLFSAMFYTGLGLAVFVYVVAMFTFHVFDG